MARVNAASGHLRANTIMGVARTIGHPLDARFQPLEPFIKLAIPVLVGIFTVLLAMAGAFLLTANRQDALEDALHDMDLLAGLAQREIALRAQDHAPGRVLPLAAALHPATYADGRQVVITDEKGDIIASHPPLAKEVRTLLDVLGPAQPLTILADKAGVAVVKTRDREHLATVRALPAPLGQMALVQPSDSALKLVRSRNQTQLVLFVASVAVLALLTWAFLLQTRRATAANLDCERVRERLDAALNSGRCGLWDWDLGKGRIYWSNSMYRILGFDRQGEFLSFGAVNALIHPEDTDLYEVARALSAGEQTGLAHDFRIKDASGAWVWLRARAELVVDSSTGGKHMVGIAVDITEERRIAAESATARMRLWDAIETVPEAFVLWDNEQRLVTCNSRFRKLHQLPAHAIQPGLHHAEVMAHATPPVIEEDILRERNLETQSRISEVKLADGRWLQVSERRTKDGGSVSIGTDVTLLKEHEVRLMEGERRLMATISDLKSSRRQLEAQAQQLTDLAERYLEQKAEAEAANRAKTQFLANMSHDLRTPLNAIIGFSDIMESGLFGSLGCQRHLGYCRDIKSSGMHLLEIVDDILEMSQLEAGEVRIQPARLAVRPAVETALQSARQAISEKQLQLDIDMPNDLAVMADAAGAGQILVNLIGNAAMFTPRGGGIAIRARACGNMVNVYVADSGIGIPQSQLDRIGRPFEQIEGGQTARSHKGSGLGLAIARAICTLHGGSLRIRSRQGENAGTVVLARLPLAEAEPTLLS